VIFGDPENPDRVIVQETQYNTHINLDTGYALSEVDHVVSEFTAADSTFKQVGRNWALRDATGRLLVQEAGQIVFNTDTGEVVKVTSHLTTDFAGLICPALGGNPA
jgi:hypothetical protein